MSIGAGGRLSQVSTGCADVLGPLACEEERKTPPQIRYQQKDREEIEYGAVQDQRRRVPRFRENPGSDGF